MFRSAQASNRSVSLGGLVIAAALSAGVTAIALDPDAVPAIKDKAAAFGLLPSCRIKANIGFDGGERIYHLPGQEFYSATRIRLDYGERYFCSEAEARAAGWRKARR